MEVTSSRPRTSIKKASGWPPARLWTRSSSSPSTPPNNPYPDANDRVITSNYGGNGTKSIRLSIEASLKKLQTSYIDLFYLHWWYYTVSIPKLMHSLNDLVTSGKVLYLGISDKPAWVVVKCNEYARCPGLRPSLSTRACGTPGRATSRETFALTARAEGMGLCPYGALCQGRFQMGEGFREHERQDPGRKFAPLSRRDGEVLGVLEEVGAAKGVALAYVMRKTTYVCPIVGDRKVSHSQGSIGALVVVLTDEEVDKVESAYEFDAGFPHTLLRGTMYQEGVKPKAAREPGGVWSTKEAGTFDWVETSKVLRPRDQSSVVVDWLE